MHPTPTSAEARAAAGAAPSAARPGRSGAAPWLVAAEAAAVLGSFYLSWRLVPVYRPWLVPGEVANAETFAAHAWLLLFILPVWFVAGLAAGMFRAAPAADLRAALRPTLRVALWGLASLAVLLVAGKLVEVSRLVLFGFVVLYVPSSLVARAAARRLRRWAGRHPDRVTRVLVVGPTRRAEELLRRARCAEEEQGERFELVGLVEPGPAPGALPAPAAPESRRLAGAGDWEGLLFSQAVDVVAVVAPLDQVPRGAELVAAAVALGLRVVVLADFGLERVEHRATLPEPTYEDFLGAPAAVFSDVDWPPGYRLAKRVMDVAISGALLVALAPLFAAIAVAIRLASPGGPVLYRWQVLGRNRRPVTSYKFRTMVPDADRRRPALEAANEMRGPAFKMRDDPRITPLGRWLRRTSLDELPQLWSVFKGDLSLVGPRPPFPSEADEYEFWQRRKLAVKPGITCLWQVSGRGEIRDFNDWARMDLEYIRRASLGLDCWILLRTIPAVLRGRGAW